MTDEEYVVDLQAKVAMLEQALALALLWLPTEVDLGDRASTESKEQIRWIRAVAEGKN